MQKEVITKSEQQAEELQRAFAQMFDRLLHDINSNKEINYEQRNKQTKSKQGTN